MKTISDINAIRDALQPEVVLRGEPTANDVRVTVGMGDVGIEAGAQAVFDKLVDLVSAELAAHVKVMRDALPVDSADAPVVVVVKPGEEPVQYTCVDVAKAEEIFRGIVQ